MSKKAAVSYIRVSTGKQGTSGLGLKSQQESLRVFSLANGYEIVKEFCDIESGRNDSRPELQRALAYAKKIDACLIVAKLDRLARSVSFISKIMDAGTEFKAVDVPYADRSMLQMMSVFAELEARMCSERTKAALAEAKKDGVLLGGARPECRNNLNKQPGSREKGRETLKTKARNAYADILPEIRSMRINGSTFQEIANTLNARERVTRNGKEWHPMQVSRVLNRTTST